ncbi:hypothetical protein IFM89_010910 [Coptis chinensis]|uniref:Uncharacterized protein n=1 Tax=Coptis chinensis TaxID=261450 RepID=A0A835ILS8_9MAGN|nr:hypothetical protein IFM89_010910 [Coptis chinensis]
MKKGNVANQREHLILPLANVGIRNKAREAYEQVEQMHKIFKLYGSPSEDYWKKSRLPHATIFKPQHPYQRCLTDSFKDFPSSTLDLVDVLLAIEPEARGSSTSALNSFNRWQFPSHAPLKT